MSKRQQLQEKRQAASALYETAQHTDGRAYQERMNEYSQALAEIDALEKELDDEIRRADLAKIHIGKKALRMDEDIYREMIKKLSKGRTDSAADLTVIERTALLQKFGSLGWKPNRRKFSPRTSHKKPGQKTPIDKIRALWIQMFNDGITESGDERALCKYCMRMVKKHSPDWLTDKEQTQVLESLKQWHKRVWSEWYREDMAQLHRIEKIEGSLSRARVRELIDSGLIRYHDAFAKAGIEPPKK